MEPNGDSDFLEGLYRDYSRLIYATVYKILENSFDAEDAMQTTLVKLIQKISTLQSMHSPHLANYIITVAKNTAFDIIRARSRHPTFSFDELLDFPVFDSENNIEERIFLDIDRELVHQAWLQLPSQAQQLLSAKYILHLSDIEIAKNLGIRPNSVRMSLTRARRLFRAYFLACNE